MVRRALLAIGAVLLLVLPALAQAREDAPIRPAERVPSTRLQANGSGLIMVDGRLSVYGLIPGGGRLVITDRAGDARARLAGQPIVFSRRRYGPRRAVVENAQGYLIVIGSGVRAEVVGSSLAIAVAGFGFGRLVGQGTYSVNGGPVKAWDGRRVELRPTAASLGKRRERRCAEERCDSPSGPRR